jgi:hypothetical protein
LKRDPLLDALHGLPEEKASRGFTDRVLRRLDRSTRRRLAWRPAAIAAALAAMLAVSVTWWQRGEIEPPPEDPRLKLAALQAEHRRLLEDWRQLERLRKKDEPVLYLGGNEHVDLVLDLRRVPPQSVMLDVEPAAYRQRSTDR